MSSRMFENKDILPNKTTYTVQEIASLLNVSLKTAYTLVKTNQFRYVKVGNMIRISKNFFENCLEGTEKEN